MSKIAAVECGGTSFKVAVCQVEESGIILKRCSILTKPGPQATLAAVTSFLQEHGPYVSVGIASFGPVCVKKDAAETTLYGCILNSSPKIEWRGVDILSAVQKGVGSDCTVVMDTDVNAPAAAEFAGFQKIDPSLSSCAYVTVGTGVGVGLVVNGTTVHGRMHPEGGHVPVHPLSGDSFGGYSWGRRPDSRCPFGGVNTVEGLASSVALTERYEQQQQKQQGNDTTTIVASSSSLDRDILQDVGDDDAIWDHAANAIASLCATLLLTLSMEKIVLGGGVLRRACLLDKIRTKTSTHLNGYLDLGSGNENAVVDLAQIITTSKHGDDAGLHGAIFLARRALRESNTTSNQASAEHSTGSSIEKRHKQIAFQYGLWNGVLVGVVGAALVFKYGLFGIGRNCRRR